MVKMDTTHSECTGAPKPVPYLYNMSSKTSVSPGSCIPKRHPESVHLCSTPCEHPGFDADILVRQTLLGEGLGKASRYLTWALKSGLASEVLVRGIGATGAP